MPAILSHPSLVDARWIQPDVFEALEVEQVLLHPNQVFVLQLIETFQLIDIHPYQKFEVFQKLMKHLSSSSDVDSSLIYNNSNSFFSNSHSNSHSPKAEHQRMPPGSFLRWQPWDIRTPWQNDEGRQSESQNNQIENLDEKSDSWQLCYNVGHLFHHFLHSRLCEGHDFYLLLRKTFVDLEANCETQDLDQCFLPSSAEYAFPHGMISSVVLANMVTGAYCFSYRESIATRPKDPLLRTFYDLGFLAISPLLPICFQIRLAGLTRRISKLKDQFKSNKNVGEFFLKKSSLEREVNVLYKAQMEAKILESSLEAIPQTLFLGSIISFSTTPVTHQLPVCCLKVFADSWKQGKDCTDFWNFISLSCVPLPCLSQPVELLEGEFTKSQREARPLSFLCLHAASQGGHHWKHTHSSSHSQSRLFAANSVDRLQSAFDISQHSLSFQHHLSGNAVQGGAKKTKVRNSTSALWIPVSLVLGSPEQFSESL